jgi:hypothetical protein
MLCPYCGRNDVYAASFDKNGAVYRHVNGTRCASVTDEDLKRIIEGKIRPKKSLLVGSDSDG